MYAEGMLAEGLYQSADNDGPDEADGGEIRHRTADVGNTVIDLTEMIRASKSG